MPSHSRRNRMEEDDEEEEEEEEEVTQSTRHRRRAATPDGETDEEAGEEAGDDEMDVDEDPDSEDQLVKKFVRYALACEYQRIPIRRTGISDNVTGKHRGSFKRVFDAGQKQLRTKFGMMLVELPAREKVTMKEKRAAQKTNGKLKPTASYILTSTLPVEYRTPDIIPPSSVGDTAEEASYIGLYTMIVSLIALSPLGTISEAKLMLHLKRLNAHENMPMDKTATILQRMIRQGYIIRTVDRSEHEESVDWRVGPRGKVEIGNKGIQGLVKEVYGERAPEDLDKRLQRSLGIEIGAIDQSNEQSEEEEANEDPGPSRKSGRRRRAAADDD